MSGQISISMPRSHSAYEAEMIAAHTTITDWIHLIRSETSKSQVCILTRSQMQRLWGLDTVTCDSLLEALVDVHVLRRTHAGVYGRADAGK